MNNDPRYESINDRHYPPVTRAAILPHYLRLVRIFGALSDIPVGVAEARGARPIRSNRTRARTCWASTKPTTGHGKGWGRMIHDASHYVFEKRHPSARPHDGGHSRLEREMADYVATVGWIERAEAIKRAAKVKHGRPSYAERIEHTRALMARWERKAKRAGTALRKLKRRIRALERAAKTVNCDTHVNLCYGQNGTTE